MGRVPQPPGGKGSLKWLQMAVNRHPALLDGAILGHLHPATSIEWLSPVASDDFAEYRDDAFLERIRHGQLTSALAEFWPARGPQWDALGRTATGDVILVEAKAHIGELCSAPTQASGRSRERIRSALAETARACNAAPRTAWTELFYQLANRIAHLYFLRREGLPAWLVLVNFLGDTSMGGPVSEREWMAAYKVAYHAMGLGARNPLSRYIIHTYPNVAEIL
jgi:hypothetical protein